MYLRHPPSATRPQDVHQQGRGSRGCYVYLQGVRTNYCDSWSAEHNRCSLGSICHRREQYCKRAAGMPCTVSSRALFETTPIYCRCSSGPSIRCTLWTRQSGTQRRSMGIPLGELVQSRVQDNRFRNAHGVQNRVHVEHE